MATPAGMSAAMQARRRQPYLEIVALEKGGWTSYSACGIPYLVGGDVASLDDLVARSPEEFRDKHRIDVRLHHEAMGIDARARTVEVRDHARQRNLTIAYDQLHVATGARPTRPDLPGIDLDHVKGVQTLDDAKALLDHARTSRCRSVVVVGGGYIGLEMAEAFVRWGAEVTLVEGSDQLMGTLDADMAERLLAPPARPRRSTSASTRRSRASSRARCCSPTADVLGADLVVLGLGVTPNSELAGDAGAERGSQRRARRSTGGSGPPSTACTPRATAASRTTWCRAGRSTSPSAPSPTSRVAWPASTSAAATPPSPGCVGTAITKVCALEVARTGLTEREAAEAGFEAVAATIDATTIAGYLPDAKPMAVKLVAERGTGRLLGGQIVGEERSAKRIDTLAVALHARTARRRADRPRPRLRAAVLDHLGSDPHARPAPLVGSI